MDWVTHIFLAVIPLGATLGPLFALERGQEAALPLLLVIPSIFYLALFAYSIIIWLKGHLKSDSPAIVPASVWVKICKCN